jgi:tRNA(Ile)-lysidine synthase
MLEGGETVLVSVSGGADSVALLHLLSALSTELSLSLHVLHVDHGLRPDSGRDAAFVRELAGRLGVPIEVARVSVPAGGSLEAAARSERYAALDAHARRVGAHRIAVGHTLDDQAETVLMRMLSGAGVRGLAGIPPVRGRVIRPLITTRHAELVASLQAAGVSWIEDPSNRDPRFLRNRIRHEVLPTLTASSLPDVVATLDRIARVCRNTVEAIERVAARELDRLAIVADDAIVLPHDALAELPAQVAAEVLRQAAGQLGSRAPLRAWAHRGLARVLASPPPRRAFRLSGVIVEVSSGRVRLAAGERPALLTRELGVPGRLELPEIGRAVEARLVSASEYVVSRTAGRVGFDASAVPSTLIVRARRPGDRFTPFGGGERRLKSFLIEEKIPRWERARVPIVEADGRIVWVAGLRRGEAAPVTARTERVLELALISLA